MNRDVPPTARPCAPRGPEHRSISVRSRRTIGAQSAELALNVPCPEQGVDVPLADCAKCARCEGLHVDAGTSGLTVSCRRKAGDGAASSALGLPESTEGRGAASHAPVSAVMTTHVVCLSPELEVASLGPVFLSLDVSGAPVVDGEGRPLGILSQSDVLAWLYAFDDDPSPSFRDQTVGDIMRTPALCLPANESIARAAALMAFEGVHRLPVVGSRGQVIGMISPLDILRWLATEDGYVLGERRRTRP